ncbi:MAG: hypothetical protein ACXWLH_00550 [Candidatus Saccharimonadales bacterium]
MLTTNSSFPRVNKLTPYNASLSSADITSYDFEIDGQNLSGASVKFVQGSDNFTASCSGTSTQLTCSVDLSGAAQGNARLVLTAGGNTLTLPVTPIYGGILVGQ